MKYCHPYFTRVIHLIFFTALFFSCDNHRNAGDMRQIMAKDEILSKLHKVSSFDITGFSENVVHDSSDTNFKKMIRYVLDITYIDSNKVVQNKKGIVLFTPDGKSIVNSKITDR